MTKHAAFLEKHNAPGHKGSAFFTPWRTGTGSGCRQTDRHTTHAYAHIHVPAK